MPKKSQRLPETASQTRLNKAATENAGKKKISVKKADSGITSDSEKVKAYMAKLNHPLKAEIQEVRDVLKSASKITERIKWNAPSYYYKSKSGNGSSAEEDLVTFNARATSHVHLVFHHPEIVRINSPILEGDYTNRRMTYFENMEEVKTNKKELQRVITELVKSIEMKSSNNKF